VSSNVNNNYYAPGNGYGGYGYAANPVAATAVVAGTAAVVGATVAAAATPAPVYVAPAPVSVTAVATLPCTAAAIQVQGVAFYQCGPSWYTRAYISGNVSYVVSTPPPGY
jgi:hypothetical protein